MAREESKLLPTSPSFGYSVAETVHELDADVPQSPDWTFNPGPHVRSLFGLFWLPTVLIAVTRWLRVLDLAVTQPATADPDFGSISAASTRGAEARRQMVFHR